MTFTITLPWPRPWREGHQKEANTNERMSRDYNRRVPSQIPLPHKLELYRLAVQHPAAEAAALMSIYHHYRGRYPTLLKEDFAGTAAVAAEFIAMHADHRALAVESHEPTASWARRAAVKQLGEAARDLHIVCDDVVNVASPKVDVVAALNFSTFIYHTRTAMLRYFRAARRSLRSGGMLILDAYGGPGAMRILTQKRRVEPDDGPAFDYIWDQRRYNAVNARIDCRIHFDFGGGKVRRNAFRYDWRLWTLPELVELLHQAGFAKAEVWCDQYDAKAGRSDGRFKPVKTMNEREDWVAFVAGAK